MAVTLTIKQVPNRVLVKLRHRAAASHRSLQGELLAILEQTVEQPQMRVQEPETAYAVRPLPSPKTRKGKASARKLTLMELWTRARRLGPPSKSESAALIRSLRDERHRR